MHINLSSCRNADDNEDYIDFEVTCSPSSSSSSSSAHSREFEFQMSANSVVTEPLASPADELFYKGQLLPLHLPPRLRMVQNLLQSSLGFEEKSESSFDTCNNTPTSSCRVSGELNPEDLFYECSTEMSCSSINESSSNSWSKKIKLMKQSSLSLTLKASKVFFKSLFSKHLAEDIMQKNEDNGDNGVVSKTKEYINKYMKMAKRNPFGTIQQGINQVDGNEKEKIIEEISNPRRSFSLSMKKNSSTKSTSSSSSSSLSSSSSASSSLSTANSNGVDELRRSSSAKSEIESSIEGAIAYCKQSHTNEKVSEVGFGSFSSSRDCENQERPGLGLCRG